MRPTFLQLDEGYVFLENESKLFRVYSLYAWSLPALVTIGALLNFHFYKSHDSFKVELLHDSCNIDKSYENM